MKTTTIHTREILAWIALAFAVALFSVSFSFAQEKKDTDQKPEIKIRIQKDDDGKKVRIDTTVAEEDLPALKEYLKSLDIDFDAEGYAYGDGKGSGKMRMFFRHPEMSKEERAAFERDMEKLRKEMKELNHDMKDFHIEMYGFDDEDPENFDLHFKLPGGAANPKAYYFKDGDGKKQRYQYRFHSFGDEIPDSLNTDEHILLYGGKGEETPVFEREIVTGDGNKVFVFKRRLPRSEQAQPSASMPVTRVKAYPNPGSGKFSISFMAVAKGDVQVSITDAKGQEVYSKTLKEFSGEYSEAIDISAKGKGTYFLKIAQGDESITKKLVVE